MSFFDDTTRYIDIENDTSTFRCLLILNNNAQIFKYIKVTNTRVFGNFREILQCFLTERFRKFPKLSGNIADTSNPSNCCGWITLYIVSGKESTVFYTLILTNLHIFLKFLARIILILHFTNNLEHLHSILAYH